MQQIREYRNQFYAHLSKVANWDNPHCDMIRKIRATGGYDLTQSTRWKRIAHNMMLGYF